MTIGAGAIGSTAIGAGPSSLDAGDAIELPLRLLIQAGAPIECPLRLLVGETIAAIDLPLRLRVLDAAVLGGLNGSGGWPSAPHGRWRPVVHLGDIDVSGWLMGEVVVQHADNEARTAEFDFVPAEPIEPMSLIGRKVIVEFAQRLDDGGPWARQTLFQGVLERPSIDLQSGIVSCTCHDQMSEVFANTDRAWIEAAVGGRWRAEVSGEAADNWAYLEARRASVPVSVVLDEQQQPRVLHWHEGLIDETVQEPDVEDGSLSVDLPSRDSLRTRIRCRMQYRYQRLRGRSAVAGYAQPVSFFIAAGQSKLWLTTAMVKASAENLRGWDLASLRIDHPLPAVYPLGPSPSDGFYLIPRAIAPTLALGFEARYSTRWQQTITEDYSIDLVLPELEAAVGPISEELGATIDVPFDSTNWQSDASVEPVLEIPAVGDVILPWHPEGVAPSDRDEVIRTLLDRAWVRLWSASRSGRVRFSLPLRPNMWLDRRVRVQTERIDARGKVSEVEHRMSVESGRAITSVTLAIGLPGNTTVAQPTWTLPVVPSVDDERPSSAYSFEVGTYVGGEVVSAPFDETTMIGFATNRENPPALAENFYPHQLSIRAPDVEERDRDPVTLEVVASIATAIPTDLLELG